MPEGRDYPPFVPDKSKHFDVKYTGRCFCGHVEYELSCERPLDARFCHCKTCQRLHGAPFHWSAVIEKNDMRFTKGVEELVFWKTDTQEQQHELPCKVSCGHCRSPIMDEGRTKLHVFPTLIDFPSEQIAEKFYATNHVFYEKRVVDVKDGLPKWSGLKNDSERIPEA